MKEEFNVKIKIGKCEYPGLIILDDFDLDFKEYKAYYLFSNNFSGSKPNTLKLKKFKYSYQLTGYSQSMIDIHKFCGKKITYDNLKKFGDRVNVGIAFPPSNEVEIIFKDCDYEFKDINL